MVRKELKKQAEDYIELLYLRHKESDIEVFKSLINILFTYIDLTVEEKIENAGISKK